METSKIRDKLLEQRALYAESVRRAEDAAKRITELIASVSDEDANLVMEAVGFNYEIIRSFNLEQMKTDADYLATCESQLCVLIEKLHKYLEEALDV